MGGVDDLIESSKIIVNALQVALETMLADMDRLPLDPRAGIFRAAAQRGLDGLNKFSDTGDETYLLEAAAVLQKIQPDLSDFLD